MTHQYPGGKPAYRGAESYIYEVELYGRKALLKLRVEKRYRSKVLDERLRARRTVSEAKAILEALKQGVDAPAVLYVDVEHAAIVLEKVEGVLLRDLIESEGPTPRIISIVEKLGEQVAKLHEAGIVHGDLTTSNVIVAEGDRPFIIDFGLAERSGHDLDMAVDVHLFLRSLESTHPEHVEPLYNAFLKGYAKVRGAEAAERVRALVERIRSMGRYVEEAKRVRTVWGAESRGE